MKKKYDELHGAVTQLFSTQGFSVQDSEIIAESILYAEFRGIPSHGLSRIPFYLNKIKSNEIRPDHKSVLTSEMGPFIRVDGNESFGILTTHSLISKLVDKTNEIGVSIGLVKNSSHFCTAGYFAKLAADKGCICLVMSNSTPYVAPLGTNKRVFGTNPISLAIPRRDNSSYVLDFSTSAVTKGAIDKNKLTGDSFLKNVLQDKNSKETNDVNSFCENSTILPLGHGDGNPGKGLALSAFVDLFAGVITESAFGEFVNKGNKASTGHFVLCFKFDPQNEDMLFENFDLWIRMLEKNFSGVSYYPGERAGLTYKENIENGVEINENINNILKDYL